MAKRKVKGRPSAKPQPQANVKTGPNTNQVAAIAVIVMSLAVLVYYALQPGNTNQAANNAEVAPVNSNQPLSPPMTGVEVKTVGTIDASKAKVATFKLVELAGTDCLETIAAQFGTTGGIGQVRADYDNQLCEVQYDGSKVSEDKIIEALSKANHQGQVTSQKITSTEPAKASAEDTQK
ncbi:MAG: heavy-metal-associated domain-containing protein [Actinobacteria bacterium]|nr:heavy-metal-associated domain-containing protein [Actinomycetota bacterium]